MPPRRGEGMTAASRPAPPQLTGARPTLAGSRRQRAPALRFGDPRVQALAGALGVDLLAVTGITNQSLRALMTGLLGEPYGMNRASYDLTRLRRNGLITRVPGHNLYQLTADGQASAIFLHQGPQPRPATALATAAPQAPPPLRAALRTIDQQVDARFHEARLR